MSDAERLELAAWMYNCFFMLDFSDHFNSQGGAFFRSQMDGLDRSGQRRRNIFAVTFVRRKPLRVMIRCGEQTYE